MILVYSAYSDNKLQYVASYIFEYRLGLTFQIITDKEAFNTTHATCKVNYSNDNQTSELKIPSSDYFSNFGKERIPEIQRQLNINEDGELNFDAFASCFYLLARVEEYNGDIPKDAHDRFRSSSSILAKLSILDVPIIDYWIQSLANFLNQNQSIQTSLSEYSLKSTLDIDQFFAFKHKPFAVRLGGTLKDFFTINWTRLRERFQSEDPYDRISDIISWHKELGIKLTTFILVADRGTYDKNISSSKPVFLEKVSKISKSAEIGIHPSYYSMNSLKLIQKQKHTLEPLIGESVILSRQHFLRMTMPSTYNASVKAGIEMDYSMGYADRLGYQAGTSVPFYWFDFEQDAVTSLLIHPFQMMDVTFKNYLNLSPEQALEKAQTIIAHNKAVNGCTCLIWHNSSFYAAEGWAGWETTYRKLLIEAMA